MSFLNCGKTALVKKYYTRTRSQHCTAEKNNATRAKTWASE